MKRIKPGIASPGVTYTDEGLRIGHIIIDSDTTYYRAPTPISISVKKPG